MTSRGLEDREDGSFDRVLSLSVDGRPSEEVVQHIADLGRALSDPVRVEMLMLIASGRQCCPTVSEDVPATPEDEGVCVCELVDYFNTGQSRVSYHLRRLKEADLVQEEKRGRWSFYSLNRDVVMRSAGILEQLTHRPKPERGLQSTTEHIDDDNGGAGTCCEPNS